MSELSDQRKKDIVYKLVKKNGISQFSEKVLEKTEIFNSTDHMSFNVFSEGISLYAICDFEKMVEDYKNITGNTVPVITVVAQKKAYIRDKKIKGFKDARSSVYKQSVIEEILFYFKEDYVKYNKEYVSIFDFSRYIIALKSVEFDCKTEGALIKGESIKLRKRIEAVKNGSSTYFLKFGCNIRMIETGFKKKDICHYFNVEDLIKLEKYYSK